MVAHHWSSSSSQLLLLAPGSDWVSACECVWMRVCPPSLSPSIYHSSQVTCGSVDIKIRNKSQRSVDYRAALTLSTERLSEREGERKRKRESTSSKGGREGRERGRYGGERLSETSVGVWIAIFSSAMSLALLHAHDARSWVCFHCGNLHSPTELSDLCIYVWLCVCARAIEKALL